MPLFNFADTLNKLYRLQGGEEGIVFDVDGDDGILIDGVKYDDDIKGVERNFLAAIKKAKSIKELIGLEDEELVLSLLVKSCNEKNTDNIFTLLDAIIAQAKKVDKDNWQDAFNKEASRSKFFHLACTSGNMKLIQYLVNKSFISSVDLTDATPNQYTPLFSVFKKIYDGGGDVEALLPVMKYLITKCGADVDIGCNPRKVPAIVEACDYEHDKCNMDVINLLCEHSNKANIALALKKVTPKTFKKPPTDANRRERR